MAVTATYLDDLSRVRVAFTGAPAAADTVKVERSLDQIRWSTVRGGGAVPVVSGAGHVDDYEFTAGVLNYYRVSYVDAGPIQSVDTPGAVASGNNVSLTPALPTTSGANGMRVGDTMLLLASIGNASVGTVNTPAGWNRVMDIGNVSLFSRRYVAGDTAPTVTFANGVANSETMAQITAFHNMEAFPTTLNGQQNASAQNVALPPLTVTLPFLLNLWVAWKADAWTSAASGRGFAEIGEWTALFGTAGSSMWWEYTVQGNTDIDFGAATLTVTGGVAAISRGGALNFRPADFVTQETANVTPVLDSIWLKTPARPSLNRKIMVTGISDIDEAPAGGYFKVVGRRAGIAITDVRDGQAFTLTVRQPDAESVEDFRAALSYGLPMFLQGPTAACAIPTAYVTIGKVTRRFPTNRRRTQARYFDLAMQECAAPAGTIFATTYTYDDLDNDYVSYDALLADTSIGSYSDLLDQVSDQVVIVP